jgi:hypothetical protein
MFHRCLQENAVRKPSLLQNKRDAARIMTLLNAGESYGALLVVFKLEDEVAKGTDWGGFHGGF